MINNILPPTIAAVAVISATISSIDVAVKVVQPDPISGTGYVTGPVVAGQNVLIDWEIIKTVDCPGETSRVWDGEQNFHLTEPQQSTSLPMGRITPKIQTEIPALAPPGDLRLSIVGYYECEDSGKIPFTLGPVEMVVRK